MLALLVLHLCKVSCLCRCIVQRLGSADISVLAYNFWQATKASLLWAWPQGGSQGRQSPYSPPARMPGVYAQGLCTMQSQPSIHSLSRGKGVFGKDAEIRTHQALHEAKPMECPKGDRDNKSEVYFKNRLFLQTKRALPCGKTLLLFYLEYYMQLMQLFALLSGI